MKKLLLVVVASLTMMACTSTDYRERESHSFNYAGTLAPLEVSIWQYGTHTLTTDNGGFYAVKSDDVDLNQYNNMVVEVEGSLVEGYPVDSGPEFLDVVAIQPVKE